MFGKPAFFCHNSKPQAYSRATALMQFEDPGEMLCDTASTTREHLAPQIGPICARSNGDIIQIRDDFTLGRFILNSFNYGASNVDRRCINFLNRQCVTADPLPKRVFGRKPCAPRACESAKIISREHASGDFDLCSQARRCSRALFFETTAVVFTINNTWADKLLMVSSC